MPTLTQDPAGVAAEPLARGAAEEEAGGPVGAHRGVVAEGERVVTHYFESLDPAYRGWCWAVTVARASRAHDVTIDEVALLPGDGAVLPPPWVPWAERLRPGDLGVGDLLPTPEDDARLVPAFFALPTEDEEQAVFELGLGRSRVLSPDGRAAAAERWYEGEAGPRAAIAQAAPAGCGSCGFYLPVAGGLRGLFGVCGNEFAPDDGRVVSADHGCGAHSEAVVVPTASDVPPPVVDEFGYEPLVVGPLVPAGGSVADSDNAEPFGHS